MSIRGVRILDNKGQKVLRNLAAGQGGANGQNGQRICGAGTWGCGLVVNRAVLG